MTFGVFPLLAALVVGTWNGNWFPSGRAEHRAHPEVEAATCRAAARMLADGLRRLDPDGTNDVILCLNEIRNPLVASNLVAQIGRTNLAVAVVSRYRRRDRFDQQQDVIATTLPVAESNWSLWRRTRQVVPPRGFAHARVVVSPAVTAAVYAVHLKSNYGATTSEMRELNRKKRELPAQQLLALECEKRGRKALPVVVAGDFNSDPWSEKFAGETTFAQFKEAGYACALEALPPDRRGTCPSKRWGDSSFDHVLFRALKAVAPPVIVPNESLSDHKAVFVLLE